MNTHVRSYLEGFHMGPFPIRRYAPRGHPGIPGLSMRQRDPDFDPPKVQEKQREYEAGT